MGLFLCRVFLVLSIVHNMFSLCVVFLFGLAAFGPVVVQGQQKVLDDLLPFDSRLGKLDLEFDATRHGCESAVGSDLLFSLRILPISCLSVPIKLDITCFEGHVLIMT
jgi:hypothetical protein